MTLRVALLRTLIALLGSVLSVACGHSRPMLTPDTAPPFTLLVSPPADPDHLQQAIVTALESRGYRIEGVEPGRLAAWNQGRGGILHLTIEYQPNQVVVRYAGSENLDQRTYDGWMNNLERSLRQAIIRPAPEAVQQQPPPPPVARGPEPMTVIIAPSRDPGVVRGAIARALVERRYVVESEEGARISARYTRGDNFLRIAVDYTGERAVITYVEAQNVDLSEYEGWMRGLQQTIQQELSRS